MKQLQKLFREAGIQINGSRPWDIQVHDDQLWRRMALHGSMGFGEAYMDGWWDCTAIDQLVHRLLTRDHGLSRETLLRRLLGSLQSYFMNLQKLSRAFIVGRQHYDIGNGLYRRMLGEDMVYSCGWWQGGAASLADAQWGKMDMICRKIGLQEGMRVLDIGCGWGSFCFHAAQNYGVEVLGLTISREQAKWAREKCADLPVEIRLQDYREVRDRFDRIVSVGMFEHVGPRNYNVFFDVARRCLESDGLFMLHTIGSNISYSNPHSWMTRYIFPNGHIPSIAQIGSALERRFVAEDLHNFGADYDRTLMAWESNFRDAWQDIRKESTAYDDRFYRMWRYYLLSCAGSFRARHTQLWQWVLSPEGLPDGYRRL